MKSAHLFRLLAFLPVFTITTFAFAQDASLASSSPLCFIENRGQIAEPDGAVADEVLFSVRQDGLCIFVYRDGLSYQFQKTTTAQERLANTDADIPLMQQLETHRFEVRFVGAQGTQVTTEEALPYYETFYSDVLHSGIQANAFQKIIIHELYPNIDWVIYAQAGKLKYDIIVHPGGDPSAIKMSVAGAETQVLNDGKQIQYHTLLGDVLDGDLFCYQQDTSLPVEARFTQEDDRVYVELSAYNKTQDLIIDPSLEWSTFYGGFGEDAINSMTADAGGNIYFTGYTASNNAIAHLGYATDYFGGTYDAYVVKMDTSGNRIWSTYFGGKRGDFGTSIVAPGADEIYVSGFAYSNNFITTAGAYQTSIAGDYDAFLLKFDSAGNLLFSTLFGGPSGDFARGVDVDNFGNVYLSGSTISTSGIAVGGWQTIQGGGSDAFIAKFSGTGTFLWSTYLGGEGDDFCRGIRIDDGGDVYLAGYGNSATGIAYNAFDSTWQGNYDCIFAKYSTTGTLLWSTYFGGFGDDNGNAVDLDAAGNAYFAIQTGSSTGLAFDGMQMTNGGGVDMMLAKFSPSGDRIWSTYYGGFWEDMAKSVRIADDAIYVAGHAMSAGLGLYGYENMISGYRDGILCRFDTEGNLIWSTYAGGFFDEFGRSIAITEPYTLFWGGKSFSYDYPTTFGAYQMSYGGGIADGFLQKVKDCASPLTFYADDDGDGDGNVHAIFKACVAPPGGVADSTDCDDNDPTRSGLFVEVCNGIDDDCDGNIDDGTVLAEITALGATAFCNGNTVTLEATFAPDHSYQWTKNGVNIPGATSTIYTANLQGDYAVIAEVPGGCTALSPVIPVIVYAKPNPVITHIGDLNICISGSVQLKTKYKPGHTYQWYKDGLPIAGATGNMHIASTIGEYNVRQTNTYGCSKNSAPVTVISICRSSEMDAPTLQLFPNPATQHVQITGNHLIGEVHVQLFNLHGELIQEELLTNSNQYFTHTMQLKSGVAAGLYLVVVSNGELRYSSELVVAR